MNLQTARAMLVVERLDWRKPKLSWLRQKFSRSPFSSNRRRAE
jgi:hypothetical protein